MGKPFSHREFEESPLAAGGPGTGGYRGIEDWVRGQGLGMGGDAAKRIISEMMGGDYSGLASTLLSPIHDRYATNLREAERNMMMGANKLMLGQQPALAAGLQNSLRRQMAESEGLAYGQAIPSLLTSQQGALQSAMNSRRQAELGGLEAATKTRLGAGQFVTQPGWFDRLGQVAGTAMGIANPLMGMLNLGGWGGGGSPGGGGYFSDASSPFYVPPGQQGGGMGWAYGYNPGDYVPPPP